jgi:rubredoxin
MSTAAVKLLAECRERGISLRPGEGDKLRVSPPPERLPGEIVEKLKRHKVEILALLTQQQPSSWPCPHCGQPAEVEAVEPSLDKQRMLIFWICPQCEVWAVTPSTQRDPPVWVARRKQ